MQTVLRNEFFTVVIDPHSGAIRSISDDHTRGPRMAQQLAMRLAPHAAGEGDEAAYSIMAADEVQIVSAGPVLGEVVVRGRLMSRDGLRLAGFRQTTRVWRGSRVIELLIELEPERMPEADPWNSYYAARFAWLDPTAKLYRSVNMATVPTEAVQLESPHFIDVRTEKTRTTLLGRRACPIIAAAARGSSIRCWWSRARRRGGFAWALPSTRPAAGRRPWISSPRRRCCSARRGRPASSGWLFHLDVRSVVATHWERAGSPTVRRGFRVRLLETDGRAVQVNLRSFRPLQSAEKLGAAAGRRRRCRSRAKDPRGSAALRVGGGGGEVSGRGIRD